MESKIGGYVVYSTQIDALPNPPQYFPNEIILNGMRAYLPISKFKTLEFEIAKLKGAIFRLRRVNDLLVEQAKIAEACQLDDLSNAAAECGISTTYDIATQNEELERLKKALNRIGMLSMSEHAYTREFTEQVRNIVTAALANK